MKQNWNLKALAVFVVSVFLLTSQTGAASVAAQNPGISLPDDKTGYQIQLVYVETASAQGSDFEASGQITEWVTQLQAWLKRQIGKELIFDTFQGELDITNLQFNGNLSYAGSEREELVKMYRKLNPTTFLGKTLAFVVDQRASVGDSLCGWAGRFTDYALIIPNLVFPDGSQCRGFDQDTQLNDGFSFEAQSLLHEIIHSYGANHICVDSTDLMRGSPECEQLDNTQDSDKPLTFDLSGRNYYGGNQAGVDLKTLKIWSDGSGLRRPELDQGICWKNELCSFEVNTFNEQGVVQLQVKSGAKWSVVNSVKGKLSSCEDCYKYSFKNSHRFTKPGTYQYRIVKLATKKFAAYTSRAKTIKVLE